MTDKEKLEKVFTELGIPYSLTSEYGDGTVSLIHLDEGEGYSGFYTEFYFETNGKFKEYGVLE